MAESTFTFLVQEALSGDSGSNGGSKGPKDDSEKFENINRTNRKSLAATMGIQFTVAAILKQSQIFTGFIGSLFQILGAFVDTLLSATFPLMSRALEFIMKFFDPLKDTASGIRSVVDWLIKIFDKGSDTLGNIKKSLGIEGGLMEGMDMGSIANIMRHFSKTGMWGNLLNLIEGFKDIGNADVATIDKVVQFTQTLVGASIHGGIWSGAAASTPILGPLAPAAGASASLAYEATMAEYVDKMVRNMIYNLAGKGVEEAQIIGAPAN